LEASLGKIVLETHLEKNPSQKRADEVAQDVGPQFKCQCTQKEKRKLSSYYYQQSPIREFSLKPLPPVSPQLYQIFIQNDPQSSMMVQACNTATREAEAEEW
jgi:hypothetical protein